ncbi:hypothetical protein ABT133_03220 [Streptomyces sp. NPDC001835]|uniref:hypothetical protein n=1 Tax=Streptomyces sp. NPDC001835 TaxID=3154528 RepID=UPI003328B53D
MEQLTALAESTVGPVDLHFANAGIAGALGRADIAGIDAGAVDRRLAALGVDLTGRLPAP